MKKIIAILAVLVLIGGGAAYFLSGDGDTEPIVIETTPLERGTVRKVLEATGIVKAQVGAMIKSGAQATGTIEEMRVKVGDPVKKGDLIAVIDDRELAAQRAEAEARLIRNQAELARIRKVFPLQISEAAAQLELARAQADYARKNIDRQKRLVEREVQAEDFLDQAIRDLDVELNQVRARQATLTRLEQEFAKQEITAQKAVVEAEASLDSINVRISYTRIQSPIDGVVSQVTAQEGETVVSGLQVSNLITVIDPSRLEMWIYVDETDVGQVRPGMAVEFRVDAFRNRIFESTISQIYPEPEIRDNIVYYRALTPVSGEQANDLRPEMTTQCQIVVEEKNDVLALPNQALKWVGDRQVVFVQEPGGSVRQVEPKLGLAGLLASEVLEGLASGEEVATQVVLPKSEAGEAQAPARGRPRR
jgi:HlyD family secretion protein/macrolide-specific efflux system membrane fusion protein